MNHRITFVITLIIFFVVFQYTHETVHQAIMMNHGCLNTKIGFDIDNGRPYTQCLQYSQFRTDAERLQEASLHNWNEIIGYPLGVFLMLSIFMHYDKKIKEDDKK